MLSFEANLEANLAMTRPQQITSVDFLSRANSESIESFKNCYNYSYNRVKLVILFADIAVMEMSIHASAAASMAQVYAEAARAATQDYPLSKAELVQKNVAAEVSMFALKETLEMAGRFIDLLV